MSQFARTTMVLSVLIGSHVAMGAPIKATNFGMSDYSTVGNAANGSEFGFSQLLDPAPVSTVSLGYTLASVDPSTTISGLTLLFNGSTVGACSSFNHPVTSTADTGFTCSLATPYLMNGGKTTYTIQLAGTGGFTVTDPTTLNLFFDTAATGVPEPLSGALVMAGLAFVAAGRRARQGRA